MGMAREDLQRVVTLKRRRHDQAQTVPCGEPGPTTPWVDQNGGLIRMARSTSPVSTWLNRFSDTPGTGFRLKQRCLWRRRNQRLGQQPGLGRGHGADLQLAALLADIVADRHAAEGFQHFPVGNARCHAALRIACRPVRSNNRMPSACSRLRICALTADLRQADVHAGRSKRSCLRHGDKGLQFTQHGSLD